jgi:hypothetical protein
LLLASCCDGKPVHAIAILHDLLEVIEMHSHLIFTAGDFRWIRATLQKAGDNYRVAISVAGPGGNDQLVADCDSCVRGESLIDCNGSLRGQLEQKSDDGQEHY